MVAAQGHRIVFWFEFASTYSYVAASRIERVTAEAGVEVDWRPFLLGPIFQTQGWNDSPFNLYPAKGRYMWRDMERLCGREGIPFCRPTRFPRNGLLAARVACVGADASWCPGFVRAVYEANFAHDRDIAEPAVLEDILSSLGLDTGSIMARASADETKRRLRATTDAAMKLGIFGAPTFTVGDELFWGNERLDDAVAWSQLVSAST